MPFHVLITTNKQPFYEPKFDLTEEEVNDRIVGPYRDSRPIVVSGRTLLPGQVERIQIVRTELPSSKFTSTWTVTFAEKGALDWYHDEPDSEDVTETFINTPNIPANQYADPVEMLCHKFHTIGRQLRQRREDRATIEINDEYDVQDLMHGLLRVFFDDVRAEEWTPSYAGGASRMDFFLPPKTVLEIKKTRPSLTTREIGEQLIVDIARYKGHPGCKKLVCFVYDPEARVANPRGLEDDLSREEGGLSVKVIIAP
jgi:hypothetical protein